jgi:hemerythrin
MPLMAWNQKFSVGVASLDEEHQRLVALLNHFYDALQAGNANDVLGDILDRLIQYTQLHFGHEEQFLQESGYADYAAHKKLHDDLTRQVLAVQQKQKSAATNALSVEVMSFLKNWLLNHIQGTDRKYGPHLNSKGIH